MSSPDRARQEEALENLTHLVALFQDNARLGDRAPFATPAGYKELARDVFAQLRTRFVSKGVRRALLDTELERIIDSRTYGTLPTHAAFNAKVACVRLAAEAEMNGTWSTRAKLAVGGLLVFVAATAIPIAQYLTGEESLPGLLRRFTPESVRRETQTFNVDAAGCKTEAKEFTASVTGRLDTTKGGEAGAPPGWEFKLSGNNAHGIRDVRASGNSVTFTLHAEGKGSMQGGSLGIPEFCAGAEGANSTATVYAFVFPANP